MALGSRRLEGIHEAIVLLTCAQKYYRFLTVQVCVLLMCLCRVLALSFMGTNGMRSFLQSWVKGCGLPQLYLGVEILVIMVMLWSLCMGGLMGLLASSDQYGVFWSSGRNLSWEVLILTVLVTSLALLLPIFPVQVSFISSYPHSTYFHTICHQTICRKCMCFLLSKIQCLGFWINNGMEKCYWCSCFSCIHGGKWWERMEKMIMKVTVC